VKHRGLVLLGALGVIWGIPYLLIKVAVEEISPEMLVLARTAIAGLVLLPVVVWRRELFGVFRHWKALLAYTAAEIVFPWYFISAAETRLASSTAGLLLAAIPLAGVGVAFLLGRPERLGRWNWTGIVLGILGVAAIVGLDVAGSDLVGVALLAVAVVGYALGPAILSRWLGEVPPLGVTVASLLIAAIVYIPVVSIAGSWPTAWPSTPVVASVVALALVCSGVAFLIFFALIREVGPVRATVVAYINPAVAVLAGVLVLGEPITVWTVVGFVLVILGSYLVTMRPAARRLVVPVEAEP